MPAFLRLEIFPSDLQRTVDFYTRVLRFGLLRREARYAYFQRDGIFINADERHPEDGISIQRQYSRPPTGVEIIIEVDDLEKERELVMLAGWNLDADLKQQFWGLQDFRLLDPDGYYLRITEHSSARNGKKEI